MQMYARIRVCNHNFSYLLQYVNKRMLLPKKIAQLLDITLEKGKGLVIGKLQTIILIEGDLQIIMRRYL